MAVDEIKRLNNVLETRATPETVQRDTELAPALVFSHQEPLQTPSLFVPAAGKPQLENGTLSSEATDDALIQRLLSSKAPAQGDPATAEESTSMARTWNVALGRFLSSAPEQDLLLRANIYQGLRKYEALQVLSENARIARLKAQLITDPEPAVPSKEGNAVEEHDDPALEAERVKLVRRKHARK